DVRGGDITITLNGVTVAQLSDAEPLTGPLHGWFGLTANGADFRNLRIWTPARDTSRARQLTLPATEKPAANGALLYELKIAGKELGAEWWQSIPQEMSVDTGRMVFTSQGNLPPVVILTKPLNPGLACDVEFEYQTPSATGFAVMLWSARKAPE